MNGIAASVALSLLASVLGVAAAEPESIGAQQQRQAAGWLQLKQDQKTYREGAEPLAPREAANLDRLEQQQRGRADALMRRQQQSLGVDRSLRRGVEVRRPPVPSRNAREGQQQLDRQRLEMRIERETLRLRQR